MLAWHGIADEEDPLANTFTLVIAPDDDGPTYDADNACRGCGEHLADPNAPGCPKPATGQ
ncbi:hypothetical protein [Isoptericola dokdonensis]|uniref:Uncharacterized protein n=1 Tax=Isoptericola dokdonensis DS-3 TaxID=1300344 RepID=A0A168EAN6_9MICO|nr:hypothetical protein [Isoptericola dokdonensis]ANC29811.1 hypothetical protein I598_0220 [Isoptericola dokdonensis DS-3]